MSVLDDRHILTCGDDNRIMMFDTVSMQCVRTGKVSNKDEPKNKNKSLASTSSKFGPNKQARAITASLKHKHLVVCSNLGKISVRSLDDFDQKLYSLKHAHSYC